MKTLHYACASGIVLLLVSPGVLASDPIDAPAQDPAVSVMADHMVAPQIEQGVGPAGWADELQEDSLNDMRGGESKVNNTATTHGDVSNNTAQNIVSGLNSIDSSSFANAAGINTVIQNSGANVLIQNAMVVTVQFGLPSP